MRKALKIVGIFIAVVAVISLIKLIPVFIFAFWPDGKLEYYNETLPSTEIELPYSIRDYECVSLGNWSFDSLTAKVKENKRDTDFWVYQDNYDILFGSDEHLYIRKDLPFTSNITADMVSEIAFFSEAWESEDSVKLVPNFTNEEVTKFAEIVLSDSVLTKEMPEEEYVSYNDNGVRILWDIIFQLKSTGEISYDGLSVTHNMKYYLVRDEEGNLYLKDSEKRYKSLPNTLADKIEQCCNEENLRLESIY